MALPLNEAARALNTSETTLRRWIAAGAPVARRGRRGRGHAALVDVEAVRAWRLAKPGDDEAALRAMAAHMPELLADAVFEAFRLAPDKRGAAWTAVAAWQLSALAILDHLAERVGELPAPEIPEKVEYLRKIANK